MEKLSATAPVSDDKMPAEVKAEWVKRLRSDKYKQGKGELKRLGLVGTDSYCCLGVLCEIAAEQGIVEARVEDDRYVSYDDASSFLPSAVQDWANLSGSPEVVIATDQTASGTFPTTLVFLNDEREYTFREIADVIEAQL